VRENLDSGLAEVALESSGSDLGCGELTDFVQTAGQAPQGSVQVRTAETRSKADNQTRVEDGFPLRGLGAALGNIPYPGTGLCVMLD
jgi:hypothetical protein